MTFDEMNALRHKHDAHIDQKAFVWLMTFDAYQNMCRENAMHVHAPEFRTMFSIPVRVMETNVAMPDMPPGQLCKVMD